jgi:hypothetical protein
MQCWIVLAGSSLYFLVGSLIKLRITTGKKVQSSGRPLVAMSDCFCGFVAISSGGFLDHITNFDQKKGIVVWDGQTTVIFFSGRNLSNS